MNNPILTLNDTTDQLLTSATSHTSPVSSKMKPLLAGGFTAHDIYHLLLEKENVLVRQDTIGSKEQLVLRY
jgi:hypothetical protein